jgi:hypothetical protein
MDTDDPLNKIIKELLESLDYEEAEEIISKVGEILDGHSIPMAGMVLTYFLYELMRKDKISEMFILRLISTKLVGKLHHDAEIK